MVGLQRADGLTDRVLSGSYCIREKHRFAVISANQARAQISNVASTATLACRSVIDGLVCALLSSIMNDEEPRVGAATGARGVPGGSGEWRRTCLIRRDLSRTRPAK